MNPMRIDIYVYMIDIEYKFILYAHRILDIYQAVSHNYSLERITTYKNMKWLSK